MNNKQNFEKIFALNKLLSFHIEEVLEEFDVRYTTGGRRLVMPCPIHRGDRIDGLVLYPTGHTRGHWLCHTRHCENQFSSDLFGFVRGCLSTKFQKKYRVWETIEWICELLNIKQSDLKLDSQKIELCHSTSVINKFNTCGIEQKTISKHALIKRLKIPSPYFLNRGYSPSTLRKYYVGDCYTPGKPMFGRVVVPVFDHQEAIIGVTGRSFNEKCDKCGYFHASNVPCPKAYFHNFSKWRNECFESTQVLYNFYSALPYIQKSGTVVIVEGPPDVWRMEEFGIHNSVALLGSGMSDRQRILIESSGALRVVLLTDMDKAGREAAYVILPKLENLFNVSCPEFSAKDIGLSSADEIRKILA